MSGFLARNVCGHLFGRKFGFTGGKGGRRVAGRVKIKIRRLYSVWLTVGMLLITGCSEDGSDIIGTDSREETIFRLSCIVIVLVAFAFGYFLGNKPPSKTSDDE